jgi:hypothetical protein
MPDLDLPYGPWNRLVSAQWGDYPVALYSNSERVLLLVLFEKSASGVEGMLVTLKKIFITGGDTSKLAHEQAKEATIIRKISQAGRSDMSYLMVGTSPSYVPYRQESLLTALTAQFAELKLASKSAGDQALLANVKLKDLSSGSEEEVGELMGDPFMIFSFLHPSSLEGRVKTMNTSVECVLGSTTTGELVKLPLDYLRLTEVISSGPKPQRIHAIHVLVEAALTNSIPVVIFDKSDYFVGLAEPNRDTRGFSKHEMSAMPLGFPYKQYVLGGGLYVDLQYVNADEFNDAFGLKDTDVGVAVQHAWGVGEKHVLSDLANLVASLNESKEINQYVFGKTKRVLKVLDKLNPSIFGRNPESDLLVPWRDGLGKVFHIQLKFASDATCRLLESSLLRSIPVPRNQSMRVIIAFEQDASQIPTSVLQQIQQMKDMGCGFILNAPHSLDLSILDSPTLRLDLLAGEVIANPSDRKPSRFALRPAFTVCSELEPTNVPVINPLKPITPAG